MTSIVHRLFGSVVLPSPALILGLSFIAPSSLSAEEFTVIVLPDTQNYAQRYPEIYNAQTQWIADNQLSRNIQFVSHLGDIVNYAASLTQWDNAFKAMSILDKAEIPYGTLGGNHDFLYPGDYYDPDGKNYLAYFGPDRYQDKPWFGGASPSGLSNYQIIQVGQKRFLFLHLVLETPAAELAWAQQILNQHQDIPTWVSTHRYLFDWSILGAGRYDDFNYTFEPLYRHDGIKSDDFFNNFIAANKQIYMVHCGHNHSEYRQVSTNNYGLTVHEVLADYQSGPNGGNGWMRVCKINPTNQQIDVKTYSPTLNRWQTDADSEFTLNVEFEAYKNKPNEKVIQFQQGVDGYSGTVDTWINAASPNQAYGASPILVADDDTENSLLRDNPGQALIKYTDLTQGEVAEGDPIPSKIPTNATILAAHLLLNLSDDQDLGNTTYRIFPMSKDWSPSATWNSLGKGIKPGDDTGAEIASFFGDNNPANNYGRKLDITDTVQSWINGSLKNQGVAIIRDNTRGNDDGVDIHSSDAPESALRPKLAVEVSYPVINTPPQVQQGLTASTLSINEGDEVAFTLSATDPNSLDPLVFMLEGQDIGYATGNGEVTHYMLMEDEGVFHFSASVKDDKDTVSAGEITVVVNNLPPVIVSLTEDTSVSAGSIFKYAVSASDPGEFDEISYAWDTDNDGNFDNGNRTEGQIRFATPGIYQISIKVSDDDGGETVDVITVTVTS